MIQKCSICKKDNTDGAFVITGDGGQAHTLCYEKENPPRVRETFQEVLVNCDDQVIVRQLLAMYVPDDIKKQIVDQFNSEMKERHKRRISTDD